MKLSDFAVNRPVTVSMFFLIIVLLGVVSLGKLAIDLYPELDFPVAAVITNYHGASPEEIENMVTRPLEDILGTVNGVESISSVTSPGSSLILVWFDWGTDMNYATLRMREKVDIMRTYLPDDISDPMVAGMDPSNMPIMQMTISGSQSLADLKQIAEEDVKPLLERIDGVASVYLTGGLNREIQIRADEGKLKGYGISLSQITQALRSENVNMAAGQIEEAGKSLYVRSMGEFRSVEEIGDIRFTTPAGAVIRIKDVAEVIDSFAEQTQYTRANGQDSVGIHILKATNGNIVQVSNRVKAELEKMNPEFEHRDIKLDIMVDQSKFIESSINNVKRNAIAGGVLAVIVLLFFLRNWRSTLVVGLAIPISIISTFILIYFAGITLNVMSLGGLALGVGMMVDSSIVILENIYRYRQKGYGLIEAAKEGSSEVGTAVMASTFTTLAVFLPIVFVEGLTANLFKQLALTVSFALGASLVVALTLIPMLSSKVLKMDKKEYRWSFSRKVFDISGAFIEKLTGMYSRVLNWALGHRKTVIGIISVLLIASLGLTVLVGAEFLPEDDSGNINVSIELDKGTVLSETTRVTDQIEAMIWEIPEVQTVFTSIGARGGSMGLDDTASEVASIRVSVGSRNERARHTKVIADELREQVKEIPGVTAKISMAGNQGGAAGGAPVDVVIKGQNLETLRALSDRVKELVEQVPGTREVASSVEETRPELQIFLDRDRAGTLGLSAGTVANALHAAMVGQVATQYKLDGKEYDVRVKLARDDAKSIQELEALLISTPSGQNVPLREVASLVMERGANSINREDQVRVVNVTAQIHERDLRTVSADVQLALDKLDLPPGYIVELGGQNKEMMESFTSLFQALLLAIVLVYMVMASQFESLLSPFIIMFTLPTTFIGVVLGMVVTGRSFSVPAFIGVIMLAGIVVNNGIVLVDYINTLRKRGITRDEAIMEAGTTRLRPILMTTLTTVLALLPLALGLGEGGETQAPMATAVVGGLTVSAILTLVLIPVVYTLLDDLGAWIGKKVFRRPAAVKESSV